MTGEKSLESLLVWKRCMGFVVQIHQQVLPLLPPEEKWNLTQQLRRAALSIPANIAEGYGRYYFQESIRFCYIARGSLEETYTYLSISKKLGYLEEDLVKPLLDEVQELHRMLNGYISFLKRSKRGEGEPGSQGMAYEIHDTFETDTEYDLPGS